MVDEDAAGSKREPQPDGPSGESGDGRASETDPAGEAERLRAELASANERLLRERADLENLKKRLVREKGEALRFANEGLLRDLFPVIDNLHRALDHARGSRDPEPIIAGVELVLRSLTEALARHGVKIVEARGTRFDPNVHEAIGHIESEHPPNTVIDEHQRGYLLHDRLLRPALVTVGKARGEERPGVETPENDD